MCWSYFRWCNNPAELSFQVTNCICIMSACPLFCERPGFSLQTIRGMNGIFSQPPAQQSPVNAAVRRASSWLVTPQLGFLPCEHLIRLNSANLRDNEIRLAQLSISGGFIFYQLYASLAFLSYKCLTCSSSRGVIGTHLKEKELPFCGEQTALERGQQNGQVDGHFADIQKVTKAIV